jgi:hypothetical protein
VRECAGFPRKCAGMCGSLFLILSETISARAWTTEGSDSKKIYPEPLIARASGWGRGEEGYPTGRRNIYPAGGRPFVEGVG